MTSPQAPEICPKEGVDLIPDHLRVLVLGLALAQAAGATATIMLIKMTASLVQHPSKDIHPSTGVCVNWASTASGLCNNGVSTHTPVLQTLLGAAVNKD